MSRHNDSNLQARLRGLVRLVQKKLNIADAPGRTMSRRERADLDHILSILREILRDARMEPVGMPDTQIPDAQLPLRNSGQVLNTQCEFFDLDANRIQCAVGCDMFRCSKNCAYATNVPGSMPPYCTKYMKGWIEK